MKTWRLPLLSGLFIGTSYIPFPPWASLFCFVPLWLFWLRQESLKNVVLGGLLTSFVFTLIGFNWVTHLLREFGHLPWIAAVFGMLLFALFAHLFVPAAGALWWWGRRAFGWSEKQSLAMMVLITTLCEAYSPTIFDWNFGYTWYGSNLPVYQWAEFIGFSGLSALTLLCNLPLLIAWKKRQQTAGKILAVAVASGFVLLNAGGKLLEARLPEPDATFSTLLVQANIGSYERHAAELGRGYPGEILRRYQDATDRGLRAHRGEKIDFAFWPETAFASMLGEEFRHSEFVAALSDYLARRRLPLITGSYGLDMPSGKITNSLYVLDETGEIVPPRYSKTVLLAFGEYIPGEKYFPQIRNWLPPIGNFAHGPGPTVLLNFNGYKMGPQICYESLFPWFARSLANLGAQFIVNATNDSWYGTWQEPYQHMYMTLARAIEFRRPVVRVTNTGISTVVLASGEILERSPLHREWAGLYQVPYLKNPPPTFYQRWFYLVPAMLWAALVLMLIVGMRNNKRHA